MNRRVFLKVLALAGAGTAVAPGAWAAGAKTRWRMVLAWPKELELYTQGAFRFAKQVSLLSESRLAIDVGVAPEGMTPQEVLGLVESGQAQCAHCFTSALAPRSPALEWFSGVPFGMTARGFEAWMYRMGGLELLKELVMPFGLYAWPMGDAGPEVFGWSRGPLEGERALAGVRVPAQGMVAEVLARVGAKPQPQLRGGGAALVAALGAGELDVASWHGPHHETAAGLPDVATHGLGPAWQAPSRRMMLCLNRGAYEALPAIVRKILGGVAQQMDHDISTAVGAANAVALGKLNARGRRVQSLDASLLARLRALSAEVVAERAATDPLATKVQVSYAAAQAVLGGLENLQPR